MKQCPVPGCHTKIENNRFLCDPHWSSLSAQLRNTAYNLFEDWDEHKITRVILCSSQSSKRL